MALNEPTRRPAPQTYADGLPPLPFYEGYMAAARRFGLTSNPYVFGMEKVQWLKGWGAFRADQLGYHNDPPVRGAII